VTSTGDGATALTASAITAQTDLPSGLASTDELLVSDAGVLKRMDVSVLQSYMQSNLTFGGMPTGTVSGSTLRYNGATWVEAANVLNDGTNVGIGGTPATTLHVYGGNIRIEQAGPASLQSVRNEAGLAAVASGVVLGRWYAAGSDGVSGSVISSRIDQIAAQTWTTTALGSTIRFWTTPNGTTTIQTALEITQDKSLVLFGSVVEKVFALSGTTPALEPGNGTIQTWTLSGNSTPTNSFVDGESMTLLIQDGTNFTITWPSVKWMGGTAPVLSTSWTTVVTLWRVGGVLYGSLAGVTTS
jgi:hypothetical protein